MQTERHAASWKVSGGGHQVGICLGSRVRCVARTVLSMRDEGSPWCIVRILGESTCPPPWLTDSYVVESTGQSSILTHPSLDALAKRARDTLSNLSVITMYPTALIIWRRWVLLTIATLGWTLIYLIVL